MMNPNNGLVLYYYHHSIYSQKVIMALCEKRILFTTKFVDIMKGEQYQSWFLKINPRGEVPVLKDGFRLIPDSVRIIDYLEDNFSNGKHARLIPTDLGIDVRQKVVHFRSEIDKLPLNVVMLGSFFNSDMCSNLRYPFIISVVRKLLKAGALRSSESLRQHAAKNPSAEDILIQKAFSQDKEHETVTEKSKYIKLLEEVNVVLDGIENELKLNKGKGINWLCCNQFTVADISLTILLDRLSRIGLENYFWSNGKRSNIERYYKQAQKRDSYKKAVPSVMTDLKYIIQSKAQFMISLITFVTFVVGGFLYLRSN